MARNAVFSRGGRHRRPGSVAAVETQPDSDEDETQDDNSALLVPVLAMTFTALLLILGCELLFIQDVFKSRINTVFKLYYQAWLLLGVSGAVGAYWLLSRPKTALSKLGSAGREVWWAVALVLVAAALLYPLGGVFSRTEGLATKERSLDALYQARAQSAGDVAAAEWLKTHADRGEVIVEATSNDYTSARASPPGAACQPCSVGAVTSSSGAAARAR